MSLHPSRSLPLQNGFGDFSSIVFDSIFNRWKSPFTGNVGNFLAFANFHSIFTGVNWYILCIDQNKRFILSYRIHIHHFKRINLAFPVLIRPIMNSDASLALLFEKNVVWLQIKCDLTFCHTNFVVHPISYRECNRVSCLYDSWNRLNVTYAL